MSSLFTKPRKKSRKPEPTATPSAAALHPVANPFAESHPDALHILRLSHEGRGVARNAEGKTVFVEGALPGEWVTVKVQKTLSRYNEAVLDELLEASPQRESPSCIHYANCGGCQLQHLQQASQLAFKQQLVAELLGFPESAMAAPLTGRPLEYRRKARLGVKWRKDGRLLLGFREKNSPFVTATPECRVLQPELQSLLPSLYEFLPRLEGKKHLGHLELIQGETRRGLVVRLLRSRARMSPVDQRLWQDWATQVGVLLFFQDDQELSCVNADPGPQPFAYELQGLNLAFSSRDFIQVNPEINRRMVAQALTWLDLQGDEKVLDLFCGFGNFSLPLAQKAAEVLGVEALQSQVERAAGNAQANGLETRAVFLAADLNLPLRQQAFADRHWDLVLLDPPRAGADQVCQEIKALGADKLLYVSCNPATLARDAEHLKHQGYRLERLGIMDMFPQTAHVESMALFIRR